MQTKKHAMRNRIYVLFLCFSIVFTVLAPMPPNVYASDFTLNIADYKTWEQIADVYGQEVMALLKGVADNLGMSCASFTSALASGAVSLSPYLMAIVGVGSAAYLGYDIYTNWDTIVDQLYTEFTGFFIDGRVGSAYADFYFENYAQDILSGNADLSNGIEVPLDFFNCMTVSLSHVLTQDKTASFVSGKTIYRCTSDTISDVDVLSWVNSLGYTGTSACASGGVNPLVCMYNEGLQKYIIFRAGIYYNTNFRDLFIAEAGDSVYVQLQDKQILSDDSVGYSLREPGQQYSIWTAYNVSNGQTLSLSPVFEVPRFTIGDDMITYVDGNVTYNISFLVPQGCTVAVGNIAYSELEFPLSYKLGYSWYDLLPYYYQVSALALDDASILDTQITAKTKAIPRQYIDDIDDAIATDSDITIALPDINDVVEYVNGDTTDTCAITDSICKDYAQSDTVVDTDMSWVDKVISVLNKILDGILSLPQLVADAVVVGFTALFVPSEAVVAESTRMIDVKLPFIADITTWVDNLMEIMQTPEAYASNLTFAIDMSKAKNTYWDWGGAEANALSMDWYMEYKSTVDDIIVGIAWLVLLWNVHGQLPSIISALHNGTYSLANLEYQKYNIGNRTKRMKESISKGGDADD